MIASMLGGSPPCCGHLRFLNMTCGRLKDGLDQVRRKVLGKDCVALQVQVSFILN